MTFELRTYQATAGNLDRLLARFRDHTIALFADHQITTVGFWVAEFEPDTLVYLVRHDATPAASWKAFATDPRWIRAKADSVVDGEIVAKISSVHLSPTSFSPLTSSASPREMPTNLPDDLREHRYQKWLRPEDLNASGSLSGGKLIGWIDDQCAVYSHRILGRASVATRTISGIHFINPARQNDIIDVRIAPRRFGTSSIELTADVIELDSGRAIARVDSIVFVSVDEDGRPIAHGFSSTTTDGTQVRQTGGNASARLE